MVDLPRGTPGKGREGGPTEYGDVVTNAAVEKHETLYRQSVSSLDIWAVIAAVNGGMHAT